MNSYILESYYMIRIIWIICKTLESASMSYIPYIVNNYCQSWLDHWCDVGVISASQFQEIKPLPICGLLRLWSVQKSLCTIELHTISEPFFISTKNNLNRIKFLNILLLQIVHNIYPSFVLLPKKRFYDVNIVYFCCVTGQLL